MRTFTSSDRHTIANKPMFMIKRPDPYAPRELSELPKNGEVVTIDGEQRTVERADFTGDSEFKWFPHIVIFCEA